MEPASTAISGMDIVSNVVPAMLLVIGAPIGLWLWTRRQRGGNLNRLRITDKAALGRSLWVAVVEVDDRRYLIGAGEGGIQLISELDALAPNAIALPQTDSVTIGTEPAATLANGFDERPGMGLIRRLQQMTLRTATSPSSRLFDAIRR